MARVDDLTRSLVGKKVVMALTGVVLLLFVLGHMIGNLKVFLGAEHFNAYAEGLRTVGAPFFARGQLLWLVRLALIAAAIGHVWSAWIVTRASWAARPHAYRQLALVETTYAARAMRVTAILLLGYIVYHLLDLTFGATNPSFTPGHAYENLLASFRRPAVSVAYVVAMGLLGLHLYHGIYSACQTLGLDHPRYRAWRRRGAAVFSIAVTAGFVAVPLAVLIGVLR